jgi:tetratricopeptide (TPR) repeat protein
MYSSHRRLRSRVRRAAPDRSFALRRASRFTSEVADYSWLLRSGRNQVFPYIARGNAHLALGQPERAVVDYISALGCNPTLLEVVSLKGEALFMMGHYQEALAAFNTVLAERPRDVDALSGRAVVHLAAGRVADAILDWRRQLALLTPDRAAARACVALRLAEYALARPELDRALEHEPNELYWHLYRATAARRTGEPYVIGPPIASQEWPAPLVELHAGRMSGPQALHFADTPERKVEAHYQLGVLALTSDLDEARLQFERVMDFGMPSLIEHAAAHHEMTRWRL